MKVTTLCAVKEGYNCEGNHTVRLKKDTTVKVTTLCAVKGGYKCEGNHTVCG